MEDKQVITLRLKFPPGPLGTADMVIENVSLETLRENGFVPIAPTTGVGGPWSSGDHERLAADSNWTPWPETLRTALAKPTLVEALSHVATVCNESAIRQAFRNARSGMRGPDGKLWDTTFEHDFKKLLSEYKTVQAQPIGGVEGAPPPPGTDSILTWIKGLVRAAELCEERELATAPSTHRTSRSYPYDPPYLFDDESRAALAMARDLGWVGGKIGNLPAMVSTEKQEPKTVSHSTDSFIQSLLMVRDGKEQFIGSWPHRGPEAEMAAHEHWGVAGGNSGRRMPRILKAMHDSPVDAEHLSRLDYVIRTQRIVHDDPLRQSFLYELQQLINKHSLENRSNTPDYVLASLLEGVLKTWDLHTVERDRWYGNRSLLGPGSGVAEATVTTSEKSLLPGVDITKPRALIEEARGLSIGSGNYAFKQGAFDSITEGALLPPLNIPTGLLGAVNNLYSFHDKMEVPWITDEPTWPGMARVNLRRSLNDEEYGKELCGALNELEYFLRKMVEGGVDTAWTQENFKGEALVQFRGLMTRIADGIVDSIYVLIGMGGEMGLDLSEVWRRVHLANMAKAGGPVREDGKRLKPEGWTPPDVEGAIFKDKVSA